MIRIGNRTYTVPDTREDVGRAVEACKVMRNACLGFLVGGELLGDDDLFDEFNILLHKFAISEEQLKTKMELLGGVDDGAF